MSEKFRLPTRCEFEPGQLVYFVLNEEARGLVTGLRINLGGTITYEVTWEDRTETVHYAAELSAEKTFDTNKKD